MDELESLTRSLVATPSHDDPTAAGDAIESWLREETAATVLRDDVGNVIARRSTGDAGQDAPDRSPDDEHGRSLALVGHHDVVPPDDEQHRNGEYVVERRDGRLYGRGAADMKGAVVAAMLAFRDAEIATPQSQSARNDLVFASFVGEEIGGEGARYAIDEGFAPDRAIVGEGSTGYSAPGVTDVAVAHKGRRASEIVANGESAHASVPEEGANAIYAACDAVEALRALDVPSVEVAGERIEGSLVVTEIEGGAAWNVVPDRCAVTVDERTVPGERATLESVAAAETVEWTVEQDLPPMRCTDDEFAALVLDAARAIQGAEASDGRLEDGSAGDGAGDVDRPQHVVKPHATDAGWLADAGAECVVCGPAEPGEAHTATESVSLDVLDRCRSIYRRAAETALDG